MVNQERNATRQIKHMDISPPNPFKAILLPCPLQIPRNPPVRVPRGEAWGHLTKQRTSRCLRICTQGFHLFPVFLQDWPHTICNEQPSSICFFLWLTFPCLWQTSYSSWPVQSPVTTVPRFWGLVSQAPQPWTRAPCPHQKETGPRQRWGKGTTGRLHWSPWQHLGGPENAI